MQALKLGLAGDGAKAPPGCVLWVGGEGWGQRGPERATWHTGMQEQWGQLRTAGVSREFVGRVPVSSNGCESWAWHMEGALNLHPMNMRCCFDLYCGRGNGLVGGRQGGQLGGCCLGPGKEQ